MEHQVVIITGAARGIGFGIATCFAEKGASLVVADIDGEAAAGAADRLKAAGATAAVALATDVTDRSQIAAMLEATEERFGRADVLVNNAGICPFVDIMDITPEAFARTIAVNLTGAFHCTQLTAEKMLAAGTRGRIIFITSLSENMVGPNQVDYAASKSGLRMLMAGFATRLGPYGITCNAIAPGIILTDLTRALLDSPGTSEWARGRIPVGRIGTPIDVGRAAVFLASREAEYINGITLRVDGGYQVLSA